MKSFIISVFAVAFVGVLVGCESLPFLSAKNQLETVIGVAVAGKYKVSVTKNDNKLYEETWDCTQDPVTFKLTGCHKIAETPKVSPIVK